MDITKIVRGQGFLVLLLAAMLVAGCRSKKAATHDGSTTTTTTSDGSTSTTTGSITTGKASKQSAEAMTKAEVNWQSARGIRAKINVAMLSGSGMSASGTLKIKRDEIIQISLSAILGIEVGRLEMTPEYLLIQDRINHQYMKAVWNGIPYIGAAGINFYTFQHLFWDELFVPGKDAVEAKDFDTEKKNGEYVMTPNTLGANSDAILRFIVDAATGVVRQTVVTSTKETAAVGLDWTYSNWTDFCGKPFPTQMNMVINSSRGNTAAQFTLSRLQADETMGNLRTTIDTSRYTQIDIHRLLNRLGK